MARRHTEPGQPIRTATVKEQPVPHANSWRSWLGKKGTKAVWQEALAHHGQSTINGRYGARPLPKLGRYGARPANQNRDCKGAASPACKLMAELAWQERYKGGVARGVGSSWPVDNQRPVRSPAATDRSKTGPTLECWNPKSLESRNLSNPGIPRSWNPRILFLLNPEPRTLTLNPEP